MNNGFQNLYYLSHFITYPSHVQQNCPEILVSKAQDLRVRTISWDSHYKLRLLACAARHAAPACLFLDHMFGCSRGKWCSSGCDAQS